jgi:NADH-quinone oxidoreductase E subunit
LRASAPPGQARRIKWEEGGPWLLASLESDEDAFGDVYSHATFDDRQGRFDMKDDACNCKARYADPDDLVPLERIMDKYREERGALIPLLQDAQEAYGYLDEKIMRALARGAGYQLSQVYGVATFYTQFRLEPIGEHLIRVCHGTACHVAGAELISEEVSNLLGVKDGETTPDMKFTVESVMCVGACSLSPIMIVDEDTHGKLKPANIRKVLKKYRDDGGEKE